MVITYKNLHLITFPIYLLPSDNWYLEDGLLFLDDRLLDDKNMPGKTLGIRRLQSPYKDLVPLKKAVYSLAGIIKQDTRYFIDTKGCPFIYEKTKFCALVTRKIKRVDKKGAASILWIHGIHFPFTIPRPPPPSCQWARVLYLKGLPWQLYSYSTEPQDIVRKKV